MDLDFEQLARQVLVEIDSFVAPPPHPPQLGTPLTPEWFKAGLTEMRAALVKPYCLEILDYDSRPGEVLTRTVVIVADDRDQTMVAFDPDPKGDFVLTWRHPNSVAMSNIRGDAVGCFLSH
jgi:hypothetical protein